MHSVPSILPSLYDWAFWVPFFFRIFLALQFYKMARDIAKGTGLAPTTMTPPARTTLSWMMLGGRALFFFGLGVQATGAVVACACLLFALKMGRNAHHDHLIALALISFSLVFLGPGPYAIDLPL